MHLPSHCRIAVEAPTTLTQSDDQVCQKEIILSDKNESSLYWNEIYCVVLKESPLLLFKVE